MRYLTPDDKVREIAQATTGWIAARARVDAKYIDMGKVREMVAHWCEEHPEECRLDNFSNPSPNVVSLLILNEIETWHAWDG